MGRIWQGGGMKRQWTVLGLTAAMVSGVWGDERTNVLFIYTDDQAPWALGVSGDANADTPNLDKLAGEGARFTNSFTTTPVCSPSRAGMMTSRYGSEVGITDWLKPKGRFPDDPDAENGLDASFPTIPSVLGVAGYLNGLVGKWHLGEKEDSRPLAFPYTEFSGFVGGGASPVDPVFEIGGEERKMEGLTVDIVGDLAVKYLEDYAAAPFMLSVHFREPHTAWLPVAEEDWAPFKEMAEEGSAELPHPDYPGLDVVRVKRMMVEYLASVRGVDRNVGRILAKLDELDLAGETVVIFTSDHGYNMGHNGIWHKGNGHWVLKDPPPGTKNVPKGQRPNLYDTSVKVPTLVRWPGVVKPGRVIEEAVTHLDWFPTIAEMTGSDIVDGTVIRGRSLVPLLKGEVGEGWDDEVFLQYSTRHQSRTHMRGYRTPKFKLVRDLLNPERDEFFDLANDPGETKNQIGNPEFAEVVEELDGKLRAKMREIGDDPMRPAGADEEG